LPPRAPATTVRPLLTPRPAVPRRRLGSTPATSRRPCRRCPRPDTVLRLPPHASLLPSPAFAGASFTASAPWIRSAPAGSRRPVDGPSTAHRPGSGWPGAIRPSRSAPSWLEPGGRMNGRARSVLETGTRPRRWSVEASLAKGAERR